MTSSKGPFKKTEEQIIDAIRKGHGIVTIAIKILKCSNATFYNRVKANPRLQAVLDEERGSYECELLDTAETYLMLHIKSKNERISLNAVMYAQIHKGESRVFSHAPQSPSSVTLEKFIDHLKLNAAESLAPDLEDAETISSTVVPITIPSE